MKVLVLFTFSGWAVAGIAVLQWYRAIDRPPLSMTEAKCSPEVQREPVPLVPIQAAQRQPPASPRMDVYVRPHPGFTIGRWIEFESYQVQRQGQTERVRFVTGSQETIVDSEAVDWPGKRSVGRSQ